MICEEGGLSSLTKLKYLYYKDAYQMFVDSIGETCHKIKQKKLRQIIKHGLWFQPYFQNLIESSLEGISPTCE